MAAMFFVVTMALYFAATISFLAYLLWPSEGLSNVSLGMTATGFASHTVALGAGMIGATEVSTPGFHIALSFLSWSFAIVCMYLARLLSPWHCFRWSLPQRCRKQLRRLRRYLEPCGSMS